MSAIVRSLLRPTTTPVSRRYYSSFFSSNSGRGGRSFNPAKHSKVVVTNAATNANSTKLEPSSEPSSDGAQASGSNNASRVNTGSEQPSPNTPPQTSATSSPSQSSASEGTTSDVPNLSSSSSGSPTSGKSEPPQRQQHHPVVSPKDFKLHQFFSVHRPLLLLANPALIMDSTPPGMSFIPPKAASSPTEDTVTDLTQRSSTTEQPPFFLDKFSESTPDADAAAARQLTRALTMHHAGAAVAWEDTLRRLGIDVDKEREADRIQLQQQWDRDWQEVMMDSTKRKRRKKMKTHKLKKRRRATRAQRIKIGR